MTTWCYFLAGTLGAVVILYGLLEVHYFLRMCLCVVIARFFKKQVRILETTEMKGICLTTDVDTLLYHMNNARYLREIDFARVDFYERTSLYRTIVAKGGSVVQGASTIRYRRFIRPFSMYKITSRIIYWDHQSIFMEHRFLSPGDGFIHCVAICRQRVINCSADDVIGELLEGGSCTTAPLNKSALVENGNGALVGDGSGVLKVKPDIPLEVAKWIEYNDISSANLRKDC